MENKERKRQGISELTHAIFQNIFEKFIDDEKYYEYERRGKRGQYFANDEEARNATLKAIAKRAIEYFQHYGDGNLRYSLEKYFE